LPFLPDVGRELLAATLGLLFLEKAAELAFTKNKTSAKSFGRKRDTRNEDFSKNDTESIVGKTNDKGEEVFWLCALFPQFARAARGDAKRVRARRAAVIRMRWRAERRRRENEETWSDVVPPKVPNEDANASEAEVSNEDGASVTKVKPDGDEKGEGWRWPSVALPTFALPSLPNLPAFADVEVEWRSQTNPDNDSNVKFDPSVEKALRAKMRRHRDDEQEPETVLAGRRDARNRGGRRENRQAGGRRLPRRRRHGRNHRPRGLEDEAMRRA
jgi:hypothetical protein